MFSSVVNTISKLDEGRRCFIKVEDNLIEKDLSSIKKDLSIEIENIKKSLDIMYETMNIQEKIIIEYQEKYYDLIDIILKKEEDQNENRKEQIIQTEC